MLFTWQNKGGRSMYKFKDAKEKEKMLKIAKASYEEMKKRLKGKKLDYKGYADYMIEMGGKPSKRMLERLKEDEESGKIKRLGDDE